MFQLKDVKQWQCANGKAVAVNPYHKWHQIEWGVGLMEILPEWQEFEGFSNNSTNQPTTELTGIYGSEQVEVLEVWEYIAKSKTGKFVWTKCPEKFRAKFKDYADFERLEASTRLTYKLIEKPVVSKTEIAEENTGSKFNNQPWIEISEDNLPHHLLICEWRYKEYAIGTEIGNLVPYNDPKGHFLGWFIYPDDGGRSADICINEFSHYRKPVKKPKVEPLLPVIEEELPTENRSPTFTEQQVIELMEKMKDVAFNQAKVKCVGITHLGPAYEVDSESILSIDPKQFINELKK